MNMLCHRHGLFLLSNIGHYLYLFLKTVTKQNKVLSYLSTLFRTVWYLDFKNCEHLYHSHSIWNSPSKRFNKYLLNIWMWSLPLWITCLLNHDKKGRNKPKVTFLKLLEALRPFYISLSTNKKIIILRMGKKDILTKWILNFFLTYHDLRLITIFHQERDL